MTLTLKPVDGFACGTLYVTTSGNVATVTGGKGDACKDFEGGGFLSSGFNAATFNAGPFQITNKTQVWEFGVSLFDPGRQDLVIYVYLIDLKHKTWAAFGPNQTAAVGDGTLKVTTGSEAPAAEPAATP